MYILVLLVQVTCSLIHVHIMYMTICVHVHVLMYTSYSLLYIQDIHVFVLVQYIAYIIIYINVLFSSTTDGLLEVTVIHPISREGITTEVDKVKIMEVVVLEEMGTEEAEVINKLLILS